MKDSGIEWIGEIPSKWQIKKLKYILNERKEKNDPIVTDNILSLSVDKGVFPYSEKTGGGNKAKEDLTAYKVARKKDIVINSMNILAGAVGLSKYEGAVSPVYYTLYSNKSEVLIEYFYYLFLTTEFQKSLLGLGNGIMMKESSTGKLNTIRMRIPMEKLNSLLLPLPSIQVQKTIIERLQDDVKWINKIIVDTKQSIEELKKYKQSLITEVVTKGLDKNVEMKDSGIEWIGEIPKDWETIKGKYLFKKMQREIEVNEIVTAFRDGQVVQRKKRRTDGFTNSLQEHGYQGVRKGDLVIHSMDAFAGAIGVSEDDGKSTPVYIVLDSVKPNLNHEYFSYLMRTYSILGYIESMAKGIRVRSTDFKYDTFANTLLINPPIAEQNKIVEYINRKQKNIDELIDKKIELINEYESYKKSLIYEYVTGKKEVGEEVE